MYIKRLSNEKAQLIREFIKDPTQTLILPMNDGFIIELQHFQIITPAGQDHLVDMLNPKIKFFLQPWVISRINEDNELREILSRLRNEKEMLKNKCGRDSVERNR